MRSHRANVRRVWKTPRVELPAVHQGLLLVRPAIPQDGVFFKIVLSLHLSLALLLYRVLDCPMGT